MVSIHCSHDQGVRTEVRSDNLKKLDHLADDVAAVKLREGEGPRELRQQGEERRQDVSDWKVQDEEVHPSHLRPKVIINWDSAFIKLRS